MTDEELGRAWAKANGKQPIFRMTTVGEPRPRWLWTAGELGYTSRVATAVAGKVEEGGFWSVGYGSESEAYAALGAAIRLEGVTA